MKIDWSLIILVAVSIVGIVEWIKARAATLPSWVWWIVSPVLAVGLAAFAHYISPWILYAAAGLALAQLGYEVIVKGIPALVQALLGKRE